MVALDVVTAIVFTAVAVVIVARTRDHWMARLVAFFLVLFGTTSTGTATALAQVHPALRALGDFLGLLVWSSAIPLFFLFPDGRFVPRLTRWVALFVLVWQLRGILFPAFTPGAWYPLLGIALVLGPWITALFAQIYRYVRVSDPVQRQQTKWLVLGFVAAALPSPCWRPVLSPSCFNRCMDGSSGASTG